MLTTEEQRQWSHGFRWALVAFTLMFLTFGCMSSEEYNKRINSIELGMNWAQVSHYLPGPHDWSNSVYEINGRSVHVDTVTHWIGYRATMVTFTDGRVTSVSSW